MTIEERKRQLAEERYGGICECGDHAWARLTRGFVALVDADLAFMLQEQARMTKTGTTGLSYASYDSYVNGKSACLLQREILNPPADAETGFKNGNTLDCRSANLEVRSHTENARTRRKRRGSSKYKGVYRTKSGRYWRAHVRLSGASIDRQFPFTSEGETAAARAYDELARQHFGKHVTLNFPEPSERPALLIRPLERKAATDDKSAAA
jgi:hypothetical protein